MIDDEREFRRPAHLTWISLTARVMPLTPATTSWATYLRGEASATLASPNHLDVVDHLNDACHSGNRFLGKLLEVEARHLAFEEKPTILMLAPNSLKG